LAWMSGGWRGCSKSSGGWYGGSWFLSLVAECDFGRKGAFRRLFLGSTGHPEMSGVNPEKTRHVKHLRDTFAKEEAGKRRFIDFASP